MARESYNDICDTIEQLLDQSNSDIGYLSLKRFKVISGRKRLKEAFLETLARELDRRGIHGYCGPNAYIFCRKDLRPEAPVVLF